MQPWLLSVAIWDYEIMSGLPGLRASAEQPERLWLYVAGISC